ncbi:Ral GTPase-activating protein subunit alpha-2 [Rhizophlyctis rosea]|uniref:Ral GTPase-activating protein subunit alpha-2 n=1 Tax=Rhizophlyctis rosea TaxID=64517 RepID=A0AAD5SBJ1_9FUNG|nr:Ral GTPase-activating protein subunit alpha-2 [Rhizophlyctis rosea]
MADEKRMEKLLKRAKPFLDDKNKSKVRLAALLHFSEGATEQDEAKFFQEHDYHVYTVVYESFVHQIEKVRAHYKPEKGFQPAQKEVADLFKVIELLQKIFKHMGEKMRTGWQRRSIVGLLQTLLATPNHPRLRTEGFRLLLLYLSTHTTEPLEAMPLYANSIPLNVYDSFPLPKPVDLARCLCVGEDETGILGTGRIQGVSEWKGEGRGVLQQHGIEVERRVHFIDVRTGPGDVVVHSPTASEDLALDRNPIIPSPTPANITDSTDLFEDLLHNFVHLATQAATSVLPERRTSMAPESALPPPGVATGLGGPAGGGSGGAALNRALATAAGNSLMFMWEVFKKYYLRVLFPGIARKIGMEVADGEGFATCPPPLLHALISFFLRHCFCSSPLIAQGTGTQNFTQLNQTTHIRSSTILQSVLLRTEQNREIVNEILRQCFLVPYEWGEVARGAVLILAGWICVPNEDRPLFLRYPAPPPTTPSSISPPQNLLSHLSSSATSPPLSAQSSTASFEFDPHERDKASDPHANLYLRRYIRYLGLVFLERADGVEFMDKQILLFKETLTFYRTIALEHHLPLSTETWEVLLTTLLDICDKVMGHPNPTAVVHSAAGAGEVADIVMETVLGGKRNKN